MDKRLELDENLRKDLEQNLNAHVANRVINALARSREVFDYEDLKYCVENNVKIEGLSKHYGMKFLKEFCNKKDNEKEEKVVEYIDEDTEKKNIINSYINLIKTEINKIEDELKYSEINDDDLYKLNKIYENIKECY